VEQYAETVDTSMTKAIAALVRLGLENQERRKREFFKRLKENLANDDPKQEDRLVDEFRALILGRGPHAGDSMGKAAQGEVGSPSRSRKRAEDFRERPLRTSGVESARS
jgi:hypothetical protein